eukprot:289259-Chlamydomonas_euryale.AAC.2
MALAPEPLARLSLGAAPPVGPCGNGGSDPTISRSAASARTYALSGGELPSGARLLGGELPCCGVACGGHRTPGEKRSSMAGPG